MALSLTEKNLLLEEDFFLQGLPTFTGKKILLQEPILSFKSRPFLEGLFCVGAEMGSHKNVSL